MLSYACIVATAVAVAVAAGSASADDHFRYVHSFTGDYPYFSVGGDHPGSIVGRQADSDAATWALYGEAAEGGTNGLGLLYKLAPPAAGDTHWTKTTLYNFQKSSQTKVGRSNQQIVVDKASGAIYGTGQSNGSNCGGVYQATPPHSGYFWSFHDAFVSFCSHPQPNLAIDSAGILYGTTVKYPASYSLYRMKPPTPGTHWQETTLYKFPAGGGNPTNAPLAIGAFGEIYGTTGDQNAGGWFGTVYRLSPPAPSDTAWNFQVLYTFHGPAGQTPTNPYAVLYDPSGKLYVTLAGGSSGSGSVFELRPPSAGATGWTATDLYDFKGTNGSNPNSLVRFDPSGPLFGTTPAHVASPRSPGPGGVIFRLDPPASSGGRWRETTLIVIAASRNNISGGLNGPLVRDPSGRLFTSDAFGESPVNGYVPSGTVFQVFP